MASVSMPPLLFILEVNSCFIDFTATSALPFDDGWYAEDRRCLTPQRAKSAAVSVALNSGPPSVLISSGTPNVAK